MAQETARRKSRRSRNGKPDEDEGTRKSSRRRGGGKASSDDGSDRDTGRDETAQVDSDAGEDEQSDSGSGTPTVTSELKDVVREAAIDVLRPVAKKATTQAAKYAVTKGPDLLKSGVMDNVMDKVGDAGGPKALAAGVASKGSELVSKVKGGGDDEDGGGKDKPEGVGKGRRLPVQEHVDVGVPIDTAYNQWTQFEEFPKFMHRVEKVDQRDETHLMWTEKIWGVRRQWEAEITQQRPNERIAWKSLDGTTNFGVVTFHALSDTLTRVQVNLDFQPQGLFEKTASGFRMSRRALKSDLMRFKAYIEMRDEETGEWRGEVEDGDIVDQSERDDEQREDEDYDEPEARSDEEYEDEDADEDEDEDEYEDELPSMYEEDEDDDEEDADDEFEDEEPSMSEEDLEEDEDEAEDEDDEPSMSEEDEEPEAEEKPKPRSRAKSKAKPKAKSTSSRAKSTSSRSKSTAKSKAKPRKRATAKS